MKTKFFRNMLFIIIFFLSNIVAAPIAIAENRIQDLQQRANFAYEQMMEAKYKAELVAMEATDAEKMLQRVKKSLERAEQEAETARKKSEEANLALEQAQQRWNQASDTLANEWEKP
jgi:Skp family chaperone for outer membrane proteins